MVCTFFGHKDTLANIKADLKSSILRLIESHGVKTFYEGNNGNFDALVQRTLAEIEKERQDISFCVVLSYVGERPICAEQVKTLLPEGQENALPRYAISKRNIWLINHSNFVIAYARHRYSNSWKWLEKAKERGLQLINLASIQ